MKNFCFALCILLIVCTNKAFGSETGMPQLDPEFWAAQVFWLILIFSIFYLIIWKIFLPKITDSIENRKLKIVNDLNETEKLKENAEKKYEEYNKIIEDIKKEAKKIIENNKKNLEKDIKSKRKIFDKEIEDELLIVEKEIENLKKSSLSNINKIATEVSSNLIKQIAGAEVNMSNVSAVVGDISKKKIEKYL
jgi:F-type H+-transporting ATPase subunit b